MKKSLAILLLIMITGCMNVYSQIKLPRLISDGAILQRDVACKVWGWASAGENITLVMKEKRYTTQADAAGNWQIVLAPQQAGGPFEIKLTGKNEIVLKDILFGDVWVCSGQSNMELTMRRVKDKYADIVQSSENNFIRQFEVPDRYDFKNTHQDLESGKWVAANSITVLDFSAVAYFFARDLYSKYKVPVGLINAALGGSPVEAWLSEGALKSYPDVLQELQQFKNDSLIREIENKNKELNATWFAALSKQEEVKHNAVELSFNDSHWSDITLPGSWNKDKEFPVNGVVWFRKNINIPASMIGKPGKIWLGRIVDADSVFINGKFVGTTSYQYPPRKYEFDAALLNAGANVIAVKVISQGGRGGFVLDKPYFLTVGADTIDLKGKWKYTVSASVKPMPPTTTIRFKPAGLYNRMIAPLLQYSIKGVIWYQGESNTGNASLYSSRFSTLINDWRLQWKQGDFPFLFVQLASFMETKTEPAESNWAELRQAQFQTLSVKNTAMVVATDVGEWNDIHPLNKETVGKRLALAAQRLGYEDTKVEYAGPQYLSHKVKGNQMIITFTHVGSGLIAKGSSELRYFSIAGADKKFVWAKAIIKNNKVVVWSDEVDKPMIVRYAWADNPEGANLYNREGLPASPFQTTKK